jgi:hypothetical protein
MNADHTLEEVGQQFSVTRERIRQIEAKALRMRHAQPVRGTGEHDAGASEPEPEDALLPRSISRTRPLGVSAAYRTGAQRRPRNSAWLRAVPEVLVDARGDVPKEIGSSNEGS